MDKNSSHTNMKITELSPNSFNNTTKNRLSGDFQ